VLVFIHSLVYTKPNSLFDNIVLLYTTKFKTEPNFSDACFRGVDPSLIVCVFLSICELSFIADKGYLADSNWQQFVAS
jgi:hypothetical protein